MTTLLKRIKTYSLPILSGILIGTSYIPLPPWAYPFCLVPLWFFWFHQKSLKQILIGGWITQFIFTLIGFNWVAHTLKEFGEIPAPFAYIGLLLFCGFANLHIPASGLLWYYLRKIIDTKNSQKSHSDPSSVYPIIRDTHPALILFLPLFIWFTENFFPNMYSWNFGYPLLWIRWPMYHLAEYIGFSGLSALVILSNLACFYAWALRKRPTHSLFCIGGLILFYVSLNGLGALISKNQPPPNKSLRVLITQANIGNMEKIYAEKGWGFRSEIVRRYTRLTRRTLLNEVEPVDFILWPETAFPDELGTPSDQNRLARKIFRMIKDLKTPLVTGAYSEHFETKQTTNSMFFIDQEGTYSDRPYFKTHLLAFGEYVPGSSQFPVLKKIFPQVADFFRGPGPEVKTLNKLKLGPQICYEALFPMFSVGLANKGAEIIVNITNDSWFGTWQEPYQHMIMTMARSVEVRRPLIRSTNTGISTVSLASGELLQQSPLHKEWAGVFTVPYLTDPPKTFFQKFPHFFSFSLILFALILIGILIWEKKRNHE